MINKDTQLCISIAEKPSNFGTTLHNMAYSALNLNFIYKAFAIKDLRNAINGVRALGIRGCSVSMPFKQTVINFLDDLDETAKSTGAVNTIVNDAGILTGYNTDLFGAKMVLASLAPQPNERIMLLGAGGVSRAIFVALHQLGCENILVSNRDFKKISFLSSIAPCQAIPWNEREDNLADILINATSIGMFPDTKSMPVGVDFIKRARAVMDVVVSPIESDLISCARKAGKAVIPGYRMSLEQAIQQFLLYTGHEAPRDIMEEGVRRLLY